MKNKKVLYSVAATLILFVVIMLLKYIDSYSPAENVYYSVFGWDDALALGGGAILGGLFGSKKEKKHISMDDLYKYGYEELNPEQIKADNESEMKSDLVNIREGVKRSNISKGFETGSNNYAKESFMYDNLLKVNSQVEEAARNEKNNVAKWLMQANANIDNYNENLPDFWDNFLSGGAALSGLYSSFKVGDIKAKKAMNSGGDITMRDVPMRDVNSLTNQSLPEDIKNVEIGGFPLDCLFQMPKEYLIKIIFILENDLKKLTGNSTPFEINPDRAVNQNITIPA